MGRVPGNRCLLRHRARRGEGEHQRARRVMLDPSGRVVVLLVDVAVEDGHVLVRGEHVDHLGAIARRPVPRRIEIEERPVREHDHRHLLVDPGEVRTDPGDLLVADDRLRVGDVVEHQEVDALVVERAAQGAEQLLVGLAAVQRGVVLAGQELQVEPPQSADDLLELPHPLAPLVVVVRRVREVAREDDEVGFERRLVDRPHDPLQRGRGLGVHGRVAEAPVGVGELEEEEVLVRGRAVPALLRTRSTAAQAGGEDDTASEPEDPQEVTTMMSSVHGCSPQPVRSRAPCRETGPEEAARHSRVARPGIKQLAPRSPRQGLRLAPTTLMPAAALERPRLRLGSQDRDVVSAFAERDRAEEFERVVLPHLAAAFRLARWLTRDPHDAEDVVQEAYLRAFRYFGSFSGADPRTWLLSIVRNTFHTYRRKHPQTAGEAEVDPAGLAVDGSAAVLDARREPTPDEPLLRASERDRIDAAILQLPLEFREVVVLREVEGLSYKEIASVAAIPIGTVMSRLSRAREDLRLILLRLGAPEVER